MNWIKRIISVTDKIKKIVKNRPTAADIASSLWRSCPSCSKITLKETIIKQFFVCECGFHFDYPPRERFKTFGFKEGFQEIKAPTYMNSDPLKFQFSDSKYIDKRKKYQKNTKQETALLAVYGEIEDISCVIVCSNFEFGGSAWSPSESEYFLRAIDTAIEKKVDLFCTIYTTGGIAVTTGVNGLTSGMIKGVIGLKSLEENNIVTCAIASSKTTGGPFASTFYSHQICAIESKNSTDTLFSGKRVSASSQTAEVPENFGDSAWVKNSGLCDFVFNDRTEISKKLVLITKILKHKFNHQNKQNNLEKLSSEEPRSQQILSNTSKAV